MISKTKFVEILNYIQESQEIYDELNKVMQETDIERFDFCNAYTLADGQLETYLIEVLEDMFGDNDHWISYWIFECDCGKRDYAKKIISAEKEEIDISTPEKLYDFLWFNIANRI